MLMDVWQCGHCGWTGESPAWDRHESRRLCNECGDVVKRLIA